MKDLSIGGVIMLDRAELGADEKEEVTLLEYYGFFLFIHYVLPLDC